MPITQNERPETQWYNFNYARGNKGKNEERCRVQIEVPAWWNTTFIRDERDEKRFAWLVAERILDVEQGPLALIDPLVIDYERFIATMEEIVNEQGL